MPLRARLGASRTNALAYRAIDEPSGDGVTVGINEDAGNIVSTISLNNGVDEYREHILYT